MQLSGFKPGEELLTAPLRSYQPAVAEALSACRPKELQATPLQVPGLSHAGSRETRNGNASSRFVSNCWKKTEALVLSIV